MTIIHVLDRSALGTDQYHCLAISWLRGLAALQVAAAHLRAELYPGLRTLADPPPLFQGLAFGTGFAHQAVVLFFLVSGWLVGGSLLNKLGQPQAYLSYAIDRVTRLWTVLIPTFLLMLAVGVGLGELRPMTLDYTASNPYSLIPFVGNLIGLQTVTLPSFGGNFPLWSLANESWYYFMFPLLLLTFRPRNEAQRALAIVLLSLVSALLPARILLFFVLWLMGAACSRLRLDCGRAARSALGLLLLTLSLYFRVRGSNADLSPETFLQDVVLACVLLLLLASMQVKITHTGPRFTRFAAAGKFLSEFSFTLYVIHMPLIGLLRRFGRSRLSPQSTGDLLLYLLMLFAVVGGAYLAYRLFEVHTPAVRQRIREIVLGPRAPAPILNN
ncbi:MAG: acyltransferase family protein [Pseudomonadota bacterium]